MKMTRKKLIIISLVAGFVAALVVSAIVYERKKGFGGSGGPVNSEARFQKELEKKTESFLSQVASSNSSDDDKAKKKLFTEFVEGPLIESEFAALNSMLEGQVAKIETLQIPQDKKTALANAFKDVFDANAIYDSYMKSLYEQFSTDELKELNEVYANPGVAKTVEAMQHLRTKEGQKEFADYLKELPTKPLSNERKEQLNKFDDVTGMTANSTRLVNQVMSLMQAAVNSDPKNKTDWKKQAEEQKTLEDYMAAKVKEGVMLTLAKAHADVSDQEMTEILALRSKPAVLKEGKMRIDNITNFISSSKAKHGYETIMKTP